jgi:hypothetical protein
MTWIHLAYLEDLNIIKKEIFQINRLDTSIILKLFEIFNILIVIFEKIVNLPAISLALVRPNVNKSKTNP